MRRILVVDDSKTNQLLACRMLEKLGYATEVANDGEEVLDRCSSTTFAAILMDVNMPRVDGYETTAQLRRREETSGAPRTPIIGLSARAMEGDREAGLACGMDEYLTKPLFVDALRAALERWVGEDSDSSPEGDTMRT